MTVRSVVPRLALLVFSALSLIACSDDETVATGPDPIPASLALVDGARACARKDDPTAIVLRVAARRADGERLAHPDEADVAVALADVPLDSNGQQAWRLDYDGAWHCDEVEEVIAGIVYVDVAEVTMSADQAWNLANAAGYAEPFRTWTLIQTVYPTIENPFYAFQYDRDFVFVDTKTNSVWRGQ